jgi:hypothetical protein
VKTEQRYTYIERIAFRYLLKLKDVPSKPSDELHILSEKEINSIRNEVLYTMCWAAVFGVLGVILLYLPQYYWPALFPDFKATLPWIGELAIPIVSIVYGLFLVYVEIYALTAINLRAVFKIALVCGFPEKNDGLFEKHIEALMRVGMEKEDKLPFTYGLDPLQGASKISVFLFFIINRLKATISNYVAKIVLRRFLGRYALRQYIDMVGIPVFAFWNAWASYEVIRETKTRIMAPNLIRHLCKIHYERYHNNIGYRNMIYDALQFIAVSKRKYHQNHFLMAESILQTFGIAPKANHDIDDFFLDRIGQSTTEVRTGICQLIILGFVVDGEFSQNERKAIKDMHARFLIPYNIEDIRRLKRSFLSGRGLDELLK